MYNKRPLLCKHILKVRILFCCVCFQLYISCNKVNYFLGYLVWNMMRKILKYNSKFIYIYQHTIQFQEMSFKVVLDFRNYKLQYQKIIKMYPSIQDKFMLKRKDNCKQRVCGLTFNMTFSYLHRAPFRFWNIADS